MSQYDMSLVEPGSNGGAHPVLLSEREADNDAQLSTHTDTHGDIKVQLNTTSDGQTLLVCDASD